MKDYSVKSILFHKKRSALFILLLLSIPLFGQFVEVNSSGSCEFKNEGFIELIIDEDSTEYPLPYYIFWENLTTGEFRDSIEMTGYEYTIEDLFPGDYEINIYFNESCKYFIEEELEEIATEPLIILRKLKEPSCGSANGKITLIPKSGTPPYAFTWNHGESTQSTTSPITYFINNLTSGNYCVTITDQECGLAKFCVDLKDDLPNVEIKNIEQIDNCEFEPYDCTGAVSITVSGVDTFSVSWLDPNREVVGSGISLSNLCEPGSYLAVVTFSQNCQPFVYEINVQCCNDESSNFEVELSTEDSCNYNNSIETIVTGGNDPYTYQWSNNSHSPSLYNIAAGKYYVTITDSTGCMIKDSAIFSKPIEKVEVIKACDGLFDGSMTFRINNPTNCPVDIQYDFSLCTDCPSEYMVDNDTSSQIIITLEDLGGGIEYLFYVNICGCIIPYYFTIPEESWDKTYAGHEDLGDYTFKCYYDLDCKNTHIDTGEISLARFDLGEVDCTGLFKNCGSTTYFCGEEQIGIKEMKAKTMRRVRAIRLAQELGFDQHVIDATIGGNLNPCDWINICPNDPTCIHGTAHGDWGGHFTGEVEEVSEDCFKIHCEIAGIISSSYTICGFDFLPDYYAAYIDTSVSNSLNLNLFDCHPIEKSVGELIMYLDSLEENHEDFLNTELHIFLMEHITDERKWCATVKYCTSDYSLIWSDIEDVYCPTISPPVETQIGPIEETCEPISGINDLFYIWCETPCPDPRPGLECSPQPKEFVYDWHEFDPKKISENHPTSQLMARMEGPSNFNSFLPVKQNQNTYTVNALYVDNDVKLHHKFSYESWYPFEFQNLEYLFQDFDSSYVFGIVKDSQYNEVHDIVFGDIGGISETKLQSSSSLNLLKTWSTNNLHFITGNFSGTMDLDGESLSTTTTNRFFILNVDRALDVNSLRQINLNGWKVFVDEGTGDLAFWSPTSQGLYVDGVFQSNVATREIITLNGSSSSATIRDIDLILPSTMKLLEYKRGDAYSTYLIAGSGSVTKNGSQIYNSSTSKVVILTINHSGSVNWVQDYALSAIDTSEVSLEMVDGDSIYIGLNLTTNITISGNSVSNIGERDVLILGYNASGSLITIEHYGSETDEIIKDLFYSNGVLHIGGEIDEKTFRRQIGNLDFVNFSPDFKQGYISYILLDAPVQSGSLLLNSNTEPSGNLNHSIVEVYPNPAKDQVSVRVNQECESAQVYLRDLNGKVMSIMHADRASLNRGITFELSGIPNGIYVADVKSDCSKLISRPFIKAN